MEEMEGEDRGRKEGGERAEREGGKMEGGRGSRGEGGIISIIHTTKYNYNKRTTACRRASRFSTLLSTEDCTYMSKSTPPMLLFLMLAKITLSAWIFEVPCLLNSVK